MPRAITKMPRAITKKQIEARIAEIVNGDDHLEDAIRTALSLGNRTTFTRIDVHQHSKLKSWNLADQAIDMCFDQGWIVSAGANKAGVTMWRRKK